MSDKKQEQFLIQKDFKESQRRDNYRRAEAFLLWKFGTRAYDDARRFLKGSGTDWPSLFVEFCELVEEELLARTRHYEEAAYKDVMIKLACDQFKAVMSADDFIKSPPMMDSSEPRKPMRRHWKDDPGAYSLDELKHFQEMSEGKKS